MGKQNEKTKNHVFEYEPAFISRIVDCVSDAVGDSIKEDIRFNKLRTQNSTPTRIWDFLNTKLCEELPQLQCIASTTQRGAWQLVPVFDTNKGILFTFMRETRYKQLHKNVQKRKSPHYVDCLVNTFNPDILAPTGQLSMFQSDFSDENMREVVQKILSDLQVSKQSIQRHVLILFDSKQFELLSIRAVMIDRNMEIAHEDVWNKYIPVNPSVIMDSVDDEPSPYTDPTRGLKLSDKSISRKKDKVEIKTKENKSSKLNKQK